MPTIAPLPIQRPSVQVLIELPGRMLKLFIAINRYPVIRAILQSRGYTPEVHMQGWNLLVRLAGFRQGAGPVDVAAVDAVTKAIAFLDAWDEPNFRIIRASLVHRFPAQCEFLFENLQAAQGPAAVLAVATLLGRLDELESSPQRKDTRKQDQAALALLADRGYDKAERKRLAEQVKLASEGAPVLAPDASAGPTTDSDAYDRTLLEAYAWYDEWASIARVVITRRDHQISLGIAHRRQTRKRGGAGDDKILDDKTAPTPPGSDKPRKTPPTGDDK